MPMVTNTVVKPKPPQTVLKKPQQPIPPRSTNSRYSLRHTKQPTELLMLSRDNKPKKLDVNDPNEWNFSGKKVQPVYTVE